MRWRTFRKRHSNTEMLANRLIFSFGTGMFVIIVFSLVRPRPKTSIKFLLVSFTCAVVLTLILSVLPYIGKIGKYRRFLNRLFEQYAKTLTVSQKIVFPIVQYRYFPENDYFIFRFKWGGKVSAGTQKELQHRLSEILFPKNDYFLEEPIETQAYTDFKYVKNPERLRIIYEK